MAAMLPGPGIGGVVPLNSRMIISPDNDWSSIWKGFEKNWGFLNTEDNYTGYKKIYTG
jgi:hypothetical protein